MQFQPFETGGAVYHKVRVHGSSVFWSVWVDRHGSVVATEGYYWSRGRRCTYGPARKHTLAEIVKTICRDYAFRMKEMAS